jgi:predicted nucleic acid-binding protein
MKKLELYIETSVIGFYFDDHERNVSKKEATQHLFEQIKLGLFEAYISEIVYAEIRKSEEPFRSRDLELIDKFDLQLLPGDEEQIAMLYNAYVEDKILPERYHGDLLHIAAAVVSPVDILVTYNCQHIANENAIRLIKSTNLREGFRTEISIRTPEEVILYD